MTVTRTASGIVPTSSDRAVLVLVVSSRWQPSTTHDDRRQRTPATPSPRSPFWISVTCHASSMSFNVNASTTSSFGSPSIGSLVSGSIRTWWFAYCVNHAEQSSGPTTSIVVVVIDANERGSVLRRSGARSRSVTVSRLVVRVHLLERLLVEDEVVDGVGVDVPAPQVRRLHLALDAGRVEGGRRGAGGALRRGARRAAARRLLGGGSALVGVIAAGGETHRQCEAERDAPSGHRAGR